MLRQIIIFTLLTIALFSCQKEISVENATTPTPPSTVNDSIYISKIIGLDTTKIAPLDTIFKYSETYDNLKRRLNAVMVDYDNSGIPVDTSWNQNFYYLNNDTLPIKVTSIGFSSFIDTVFYAYAPITKNLILDSSIEKSINPPIPNLHGLVYQYVYFPNYVQTTETRYTNNIQQSQDNYKIFLTKQNGNITYQIDTLQTSIENFIETFTLTYDTRNNPIKTINVTVPYFTFDNEYLLYGSKNNIIEILNTRQNSVGTIFEHYKYSYLYNSLSYPIEAIIQNIGSTFPSPINKIKFYYTN